jgi:uncharacterized protein (DUF4415 family)
MNAKNTKRISKTDWARVDALPDDEIDTSDIPALDESFFARAVLRSPQPLVPVTLRLDPDVLAWFKAQGDEYERRLNAALRIYVEAHQAYHG